ncbi:MAG: thiamine pyrophosphate-binding protein [Acidimicrobiia bacterium]
MTTVSEYIAEFIHAQEIAFVAGIPGHGNLTLYDALHGANTPTVMVRHEQSAAFLADGYARITGKPVVISTSVGPGAVNSLVGLATAMADSSPIIAITGDVQTYVRDKGAIQDINFHAASDFASMVKPVVKRSWSITSPDQLPDALHRAYMMSISGRPGPVHLQIPMDVQAANLSPGSRSPQVTAAIPSSYPAPESIRAAAEAILEAERPVFLAGGGVTISRAESELVAICEYLGIPVITTLTSKGVISEDHQLNAFYTGPKGSPVGTDTIREADLLVAVGYRFTEWASGSFVHGEVFSVPPQRIVHIDVDPSEIGRNYPVEVAVVGDAKSSLSALLKAITEMTEPRDYSDSSRFRALQARRTEWEKSLEAQRVQSSPISLSTALGALRRGLPRDAVVTSSSGHTQGHLFQEFPVFEPRSFLSAGGFSTMGWSLPAALGVKLGVGERRVAAVVGDGDLLMSCQELATAAQYGIDITVFVLNNGGYLSIRDMQASIFGPDRTIATENRTSQGEWIVPDVVGLANALGVPGTRVNEPGELETAIQTAVDRPGPFVVEVRTEQAFPRSMNDLAYFSDFPAPERVQGIQGG